MSRVVHGRLGTRSVRPGVGTARRPPCVQQRRTSAASAIGHGLCLHAARTGQVIEIIDTRTDSRWPEYAQRAVEHGNLSSLSVPLVIDEDEQVAGALNIYVHTSDAFDADSRSAAARFGLYASVTAGNMYAYRSAHDLAGNLQAAIDSRATIDQAKGILIERHRMTADQAFQLLAQASMRAHRKLRDVADHLVRTGELLAAAPHGNDRP